jgi:mRNA-degrading endonuclease toxin of MazEF toxin-antitoxin module
MARILRGDVRWAALSPVRGHEQGGRRPVLILSHDVFNERSGTVIAVAMTSQQPRAGLRTEEFTCLPNSCLDADLSSFALLQEWETF